MQTTHYPIPDYPGCQRLHPGQPWIMSVPVVSTLHIPSVDRARLLDPTEREGDVLATITGETGHIIVIEEPDEWDTYSPEFRAVVQTFRDHGFSYLRLDADGDVLPSLPQFND